MRSLSFLSLLMLLLSVGCSEKPAKKRTVFAIPVYGQSLALGEEATRITDFDSLAQRTNHQVLTEDLDEEFGYLSDSHFKQWMKKLLNDRRRSFELSVYGMAEVVTDYLKERGALDTIICTFAGGQGATGIAGLGKGSKAYIKFLDEINSAHDEAMDKGWDFIVPAFCWMQGENDVEWKTAPNFKNDLKKFQQDLNSDIKAITGQKQDVVCISYQTNCVSLSKTFNPKVFNAAETSVPQAQMELVRDDPKFMASGPTYPYTFVGERVHIDGYGQKRLGYLAGLSVIRLLEAKASKGLVPEKVTISGETVVIQFNIPQTPLVFDTIAISKAHNYGFSVISPENTDILLKASIENNQVKLYCKKSPLGCKVRYAVNGQMNKSGPKHGPRGNLRDSQGDFLSAQILKKSYPLHNWGYQFDILAQ